MVLLVHPSSLRTAGRRLTFASARRTLGPRPLPARASHPEIDLPSVLWFEDLGGESRDLGVCAVSDRMLTAGDLEAIADALAEKVLAGVNARSTAPLA